MNKNYNSPSAMMFKCSRQEELLRVFILVQTAQIVLWIAFDIKIQGSMYNQQYDEYEQIYQLVLAEVKELLKRENLCNNTYLFKKMNGHLSVPLYIIAEEKKISSITNDYEVIIDAIEHSGLARVINNKEVKIIEHPTLKISITTHEGFRALEKILEEKKIKYEISKRTDTEQFINFTIFENTIIWLQKLIQSIDKEFIYERTNLIEDIKLGVDKIRKLKFEHAKIKTAVGRVRYTLGSPPDIFVRKALEDSDSESEEQTTEQRKNTNGFKQKRYRKNGNQGRKPRIHHEDFPELK